MYYALVEDSATEFWFFDDQDTSDLPSIWHVSDLLFLFDPLCNWHSLSPSGILSQVVHPLDTNDQH
jgi:hypothetical protein